MASQGDGETETAVEEHALIALYDTLLRNARTFNDMFGPNRDVFPRAVQNSPFSFELDQDDAHRKRVEDYARDTWPLVHADTVALMAAFINLKKTRGTPLEKCVYRFIDTPQDLIQRLLTKRPLAFYNKEDSHLLRNGVTGSKHFETIHKEWSMRYPLTEYISYDEMQVSALVGVSVRTQFINDGNRRNVGKPGTPDTFVRDGVYVGLVGARFEKPGFMESAHMEISATMAIPANGYGPRDVAGFTENPVLNCWAQLYGLTYFPSYDEVQALSEEARHARGLAADGGGLYFNVDVYVKRLRLVLEPFLFDAQARAATAKKKARLFVVGLGLGVWVLDSCKKLQSTIFIETFVALANKHKNRLPDVKTIEFNYIGFKDDRKKFVQMTTANLDPHFTMVNSTSDRAPATLSGSDADELRVAMYAWDSNAYPGNEYWVNGLDDSGDPAAACCSEITYWQNPLINPGLHKRVQVYPAAAEAGAPAS